MGLKFGLISLGSKSSQMVLEEAKSYFDVVDNIDLRKIEVKIFPIMFLPAVGLLEL